MARGVTSSNDAELEVAAQTFWYLCFETRKMFQRNLFQHKICILHTILVGFCIILHEGDVYKNQNCSSFYCSISEECNEAVRNSGDEKPRTSGRNVANKLGARMKCTDHLHWVSSRICGHSLRSGCSGICTASRMSLEPTTSPTPLDGDWSSTVQVPGALCWNYTVVRKVVELQLNAKMT
jgi:hypothetical protein